MDKARKMAVIQHNKLGDIALLHLAQGLGGEVILGDGGGPRRENILGGQGFELGELAAAQHAAQVAVGDDAG